MRQFVRIEIDWLLALGEEEGVEEVPRFRGQKRKQLNAIADNVGPQALAAMKHHEKKTGHNIKAVELYIRNQLQKIPELRGLQEFVHFGMTSDDDNNLAYGVSIMRSLQEVLLPNIENIVETLKEKADQWGMEAMLAMTHGQPATTTELDKELLVFADRLTDALKPLKKFQMKGKFGGAVGNYTAHKAAYPNVPWKEVGKKFIESYGLRPIRRSTQINPHDDIAELSHHLVRINAILTDFSTDMWLYISRGIIKQKPKEGEVGSSVMPQKVNPIDFENAEGNAGFANAMLEFFARELPKSRMQRDLKDSTIMRNVGSVFGHCLLTYKSVLRGLGKIHPDTEELSQELRDNPEIVAEIIQTVLRRYGVPNAYDKLKKLTRGRRVSLDELTDYVQKLKIPDEGRNTLLRFLRQFK